MKPVIFLKSFFTLASKGSLSIRKRIGILSVLIMLSNGSKAVTITTAGSGDWSSTTPNAPWPGGTIPATTDDIIIGAGFTLTVDGNRTCNSIKIGNGSTLSISSSVTLTVTTSLTFPHISQTNITGTLSGSGSLSCASFNVGDATTSGGANGQTYTTTFTSTLSSVSISGNLTIQSTNNSSRLNNATFNFQSGTFNVSGSIVTTNGTTNNVSTLTLASGAQTGTLEIAGATPFSISGTGTSTITLNGTGSTVNYSGTTQTVRATTYTNLTLSGASGTKTTTGVTVDGTLSMNGANTVSGAPTYGSSATLKYNATLTSGAEWISTFAATGGVVINSGTVTLDAAKTFNLNIPLIINSSATLTTNNYALTFGGHFTKDGTFNGGSSSITITNTGTQNIGGFLTTGDVLMTKTAGTATFTGNVSAGALTMNGSGGTLNLGSGLTHTFTGTWTRTDGTLNGGSSTLKLAAGFSGTGGSFDAGTGTVEWNASGAQTIAAVTYKHLTLSGSGAKTLTGVSTIDGNLTLSGSATASTSSAMTVGGNVSLNGTSQLTTGNTLSVTGDVLIGDGTAFTAADYSLTVSGTTTVGGGTSGNLAFSSGATATKTFTGLVTIASGGTWSNTSVNSDITFKGGITNNGTFDAGTGMHSFITNAQSLNGTLSIPKITVTGVTLSNYGTLTVSTELSGTGTFSQTSNSTLILSGTFAITTLSASSSSNTVQFNGSSQTIPAIEYYHLNLTGASGTLFPSGIVLVAGTFTPASITSASAGTINFKGSSQTVPAFTYNNLDLTNATSTSFASGTIGISGTFTPASITSASAGTINFKGASQTVPAFTYNNLDLTNATLTSFASGTVGITGTFTPASITSASAGTINFKGSSQTIPAFNYNNLDLTNASGTAFASGTVGIAGTFTPASITSASAGTVDFNGSGAQTIPAFEYNNLILSGGNTKTLGGNITANGSITISSSATFSASSNSYSITIMGNWINNGGTFLPNTGTVIFNNASAAQTIGGTSTSQTFSSITVDKNGQTLSVASSTTSLAIVRNLTLTAGTFDAGTAVTITVSSNWTNNSSDGAFVAGSGTVSFNGPSQTIGGSSTTTFNLLKIGGTGDKTLTKDIQVSNTLTLENRNIITGTNVVTANDVVLNTSGHIAGYLKKQFSPGGAPRTFELGDATTGRYVPLTVTLNSVSASGYLTATAVNGDHPSITSSNINPGKSINLNWTILQDISIAFSTCDVTFQYDNPRDHDGNPNPVTTPSLFIVGKYTQGGSVWSYPSISGTPTSTNITATGLTSFGGFQVGQSLIPPSSEGLETIYWTDLVGTSVSSTTLTKTATSNWGNGGAASENFLLPGADGFVKYTVPDATSLGHTKAFGLSDNNTDANYTSIDHCFYLNRTSLLVYENGVLKADVGSLAVGDVLIVERANSEIYYIKNDIIVYHDGEAADDNLFIVDAAIYDENGTFTDMTCSFEFFEFIADATIENQTSTILGSVSLTFLSGYPPYETIWRGVRYPGEALLDTIVDSLETFFSPINVDNSLYDLFETLKYDPDLDDLESCRDTVIVIDSLEDVHKLLFIVGKELEWLNINGLSSEAGEISKWKQGEVTFYYGDGVGVIKTSSTDEWSSGYAVSENIFGKDKSFYLEFSIPQVLAQIAIGLKPTIISSDNSNINNLSALQVGFLFNELDGFSILQRGLIIFSGTYKAGDVFAIKRTFDTKNFKETFTYYLNGVEITATDPESNNYFGYNSYQLGINIFNSGASVSNIIMMIPQFEDLNALIVGSSFCEPTGAIALDLNSLPITNASQYTYSFLWSTGATTNYLIHLEPGVYTATVTATPSVGDPLVFTEDFTVPANIRWTGLVNTIYSIADNTLTKQSGEQYEWDGSATSRNILLKPNLGWAQFKASQVNDCIFGLNETEHSLPIIDFGAAATTYYPEVAPQYPVRLLLSTYPNGASSIPQATVTAVYNRADIIKIVRTSTTITLSKNEDLPLFTFANFSDENLRAKALIYTNGNQIVESASSFACEEVINYSSLRKKLDASCYNIIGNKLRFSYTEEYVSGTLDYKIFDSNRNEVSVSTCSGFNPSKQVGYNKYELDFSGCSLSQGYYTLEVYGEKNERFMLRFKM